MSDFAVYDKCDSADSEKLGLVATKMGRGAVSAISLTIEAGLVILGGV